MRLRLVIGAMFALAAAASGAQAQSQPRVGAEPTRLVTNVLELFTSQGCSACPPADELLKTFAARPDMIALSFSVDYWDHLGWRDTLASPKNTARQRAYAKALGTGNVYTPQLVVNGAAQSVGSKRYAIEMALARTALTASTSIPIDAVNDGTRAHIQIGAAVKGNESRRSGTIWLLRVSPEAEVKIKKGENRGRMFTYANVVRDISAVGMWSGEPIKIELPSSAVADPGQRSVIILQAAETGPIIGAAWMRN